MEYDITYAKIKHGYVRIDPKGMLHLKIPTRLKGNAEFLSILLQKGENLTKKRGERMENHVKAITDEYLLLRGEKIPYTNEIQDLDRYLHNHLLEIATVYIDVYAKKIGYSYRSLKLKKLRSKRGSCSGYQDLILNQYLVHLPVECVKYVCIHEVCHLKHKNHAEKFWALVASLMPEYRQARRLLKESLLLS